jgi:hypothetical protein
MLTAVWVAVVAAAAAFVAAAGVAVYVMLKAARLMTQRSAALAGLQQREDLLIGQASAAIDRVGEQIAMTETIAATMDDVTASVAELRGRITALAPAAPAGPRSTGATTWAAALGYGVARAVGKRWAARSLPRLHRPAQDQDIRRRGPGTREPAAGLARLSGQSPARLSGSPAARGSGPRLARVAAPWPKRAGGPRPVAGSERRSDLTGRRGGAAR